MTSKPMIIVDLSKSPIGKALLLALKTMQEDQRNGTGMYSAKAADNLLEAHNRQAMLELERK